MINRLFNWVAKYRKDLLMGIASNVVVALIVAIIGEWLIPGSSFQKIVIILLVIILALLVPLTSALFVFFNRRLKTDALLNEIYGSTWRNSQYYQRKNHYTEEKYFLSQKLVKGCLAKRLEQFFNEYQQQHSSDQEKGNNINLIIDSGSTLVPIFEYLPLLELKKEIRDKLIVFTNNIAGIEELHRSFKDGSNYYAEDNYYLIGGNPLQKYMATTIDKFNVTKNNLKTLLNQHKGVTISIVTSNWILGGPGLTDLTLCAKGRGHPEFKKALIELSDYVIVVTPLGKILKLRDAHELNTLVRPADPYQPIFIENIPKERVFLFTSYREEGSLSPLVKHSQTLEDNIDPTKKSRFK
jgi:hypothetical protein